MAVVQLAAAEQNRLQRRGIVRTVQRILPGRCTAE